MDNLLGNLLRYLWQLWMNVQFNENIESIFPD